MVNKTSNNNNFGSPTILFEEKKVKKEDKEVSYWLEKLHTQEDTRQNINRKEGQSSNDINVLSDNNPSEQDNEELTQSGIDSQTKHAAEKSEADRQTVSDLVRKSNRRIISISSSFPWNLFPSAINVEESRVTFKFTQFLSSQSHSVEIKDISNIFIESNLFFATLQVVSRTYIQNDIKIGYLNKKKAIQVKKVIEGLRTFSEHNINTSNYETEELIAKIGEFHTS